MGNFVSIKVNIIIIIVIIILDTTNNLLISLDFFQIHAWNYIYLNWEN